MTHACVEAGEERPGHLAGALAGRHRCAALQVVRRKVDAERFMTPRWGNVQLARVITYGAVADWVGSMQRQGLSASRSRQAYHVLTAMMAAP